MPAKSPLPLVSPDGDDADDDNAPARGCDGDDGGAGDDDGDATAFIVTHDAFKSLILFFKESEHVVMV